MTNKLNWKLGNGKLHARATSAMTLEIVPAENPQTGQFHLYPYSGPYQHIGLCTGSLMECLQAAQNWVDSLVEDWD